MGAAHSLVFAIPRASQAMVDDDRSFPDIARDITQDTRSYDRVTALQIKHPDVCVINARPGKYYTRARRSAYVQFVSSVQQSNLEAWKRDLADCYFNPAFKAVAIDFSLYDDLATRMGHALAVYIDKASNVCTFFDSNGEPAPWQLKELFAAQFIGAGLPEITFKDAIIGTDAPQNVTTIFLRQNNMLGLCSVWVHWYIDFRASNDAWNEQMAFSYFLWSMRGADAEQTSQNMTEYIIAYDATLRKTALSNWLT